MKHWKMAVSAVLMALPVAGGIISPTFASTAYGATTTARSNSIPSSTTSSTTSSNPSTGTVVTYPAPSNPKVEKSTEYSVTVNGKPVDLYQDYVDQTNTQYWGDGASNYAHGSFDFSGTVTVQVTAPAHMNLNHVVVQPRNLNIQPTVSGRTMTFTLSKPCNISIEPNGIQHPLELFANPLQDYGVNKKAKNVIDIPPGYWTPGSRLPSGYTIPQNGVISLHSNQTLYVEGGAVVKAAVQAQGNNIKILGRGILETVRFHGNFNWKTFKDENGFGHLSGPMNVFKNCTNFLMDGVTVRWPVNWTLVPVNSKNVVFNNVKIVGGAMENDDGIDPVSCQNVTIKNCFLRTDDDVIGIKGLDAWGKPGPSHNIQIYDNVLFSDRARIFYTGWECEYPSNTDVHVYNDDIIHYVGSVVQFEPTMGVDINHYSYTNLRVYGTGYSQSPLIQFDPLYVNMGDFTDIHKYGSGSVSDVKFKNITFYDASVNKTAISMSIPFGADGSTLKNILFQNIQFLNSSGSGIGLTTANDIAKNPIANIEFKHVWMNGKWLSSPSDIGTSKGVVHVTVSASS